MRPRGGVVLILRGIFTLVRAGISALYSFARRRFRRTVILLSALVIAGAGIFGLCSLADRLLPDYYEGTWRTAKEYYDAIEAGDYAKAHAQLTPALGQQLTQGDLYELFSMADSRSGRITHLVKERFRVDASDRVMIDVGVQREHERAVVTMYLIKIDGRWRIDEIASP